MAIAISTIAISTIAITAIAITVMLKTHVLIMECGYSNADDCNN
jgi:hypothetical protein